MAPVQAEGVISDKGITPPTEHEVWRIAATGDPITRNLQITQAYYDLSQAMRRLTGVGANWCTFATWASKQAGQSIRREDLEAALERLLRETPDVEARADALLQASSPVSGIQSRSFGGAVEVLWHAISPVAAFERTSDAVARGNRKVFEEIGAEFARFLRCCDSGLPSGAGFEQFLTSLRTGEPPDGQRYLRQAFTHYAQALGSEDDKERAELLLLANLEIGFHEQTRLQPEILEAMNAPVVDPKQLRRRLVAELFPDRASRIRYWVLRLGGRMRRLLDARDHLAEETQRQGRLAVTAALMTLTLPGKGALRLAENLPDGVPDSLAMVEQPELLALLQVLDSASSDTGDERVTDWADLPQRMKFITALFRTYHLAPSLFDPPFSSDQVAEIRAGRRPPGRL